MVHRGGVDMIYTLDEIKMIVSPIAKQYDLPAVYLFGSYARGDATEKSDIDLLVDDDTPKIKGLFDLGGLYADLSAAFRKELDMVTVEALAEHSCTKSGHQFKKHVEQERVKIYESYRVWETLDEAGWGVYNSLA